jgi:hypothetical protein
MATTWGITVVLMNVSQDAITQFFEYFALITAILYASAINAQGNFSNGMFKTFADCNDFDSYKKFYGAQAFCLQYGLVSTVVCLVCILTIGIVGRPDGLYSKKRAAEDFVKFTSWRRLLMLLSVTLTLLLIMLVLTGMQTTAMISSQTYCERKIWCVAHPDASQVPEFCEGHATEEGSDIAGVYVNNFHSHGQTAWAIGGTVICILPVAAVFLKWREPEPTAVGAENAPEPLGL